MEKNKSMWYIIIFLLIGYFSVLYFYFPEKSLNVLDKDFFTPLECKKIAIDLQTKIHDEFTNNTTLLIGFLWAALIISNEYKINISLLSTEFVLFILANIFFVSSLAVNYFSKKTLIAIYWELGRQTNIYGSIDNYYSLQFGFFILGIITTVIILFVIKNKNNTSTSNKGESK